MARPGLLRLLLGALVGAACGFQLRSPPPVLKKPNCVLRAPLTRTGASTPSSSSVAINNKEGDPSATQEDEGLDSRHQKEHFNWDKQVRARTAMINKCIPGTWYLVPGMVLLLLCCCIVGLTEIFGFCLKGDGQGRACTSKWATYLCCCLVNLGEIC